MKLVVDKVKYGIVPYGADNGNRAVAVYFKEADGDYEYKAPKDLPKDVKMSEEQIIGNGLFEDIMEQVQAAQQETYFSKFLMGQKAVYFVGDCLAKAEHRNFALNMFECLSTVALETQKKYFAGSGAQESDIMKQLRAPYMVWVTAPTTFTGRVNFAEQFNLVLCKMPISSEWNQMALVQIGNHNFTSFVFEIDSSKNVTEQLKTIEDEYVSRDALTVPPIKIFLVDDSEQPNEKIREFADKYGWRLQRSLKTYQDNILDL